MEHLIDNILEIHRIYNEIDKKVPTCCGSICEKPQWHIHGYDNFIAVANEIKANNIHIEDTGADPLRYRYSFEHRGVTVFCLDNSLIRG